MSEIGLALACRGVMVSNENPASGWIPVKGQKKKPNERYTFEPFVCLLDILTKNHFLIRAVRQLTWTS